MHLWFWMFAGSVLPTGSGAQRNGCDVHHSSAIIRTLSHVLEHYAHGLYFEVFLPSSLQPILLEIHHIIIYYHSFCQLFGCNS